nr:PREDICTED: uncharacterized protein LOC109043056 [Bemisia tabaci]
MSDSCFLNGNEVQELLQGLRHYVAKKGLDFDTPGVLSTNDYWNLTGVTAEQFDSILSIIVSRLNESCNRSARTALAVFLTKLRTGLSYSVLCSIFALTKDTVKRCIHSVRNALMIEFVPKHLGFGHMSRDELIEKHTRPFAMSLFAQNDEDTAILVADGTYVYIEKSSNYKFQRRSFSMHKHRPLVKPMMLVSTTGYILEVMGPFFADAKNNDAAIITSHMKNVSDGLRAWLLEKDVLIVDRGFRDCIGFLEDSGLVVKMPHFLNNQKQHTAVEANESRLVTSVRWVVEATNGVLKTFKALGHVMPNSQIPFIGDYVRIVCSIINAFRPPRILDSHDAHTKAQRMLALSKRGNELQAQVIRENWSQKRVIWKKMDARELEDFPRLTVEEIEFMTFGRYQLKQAQSYTSEHQDEGGLYELMIHKECSDILRVQIQSRHSASMIHNLWIKYSLFGISEWYCQCPVGARMVGCCAHVASVLWFLGFYRHQEKEPRRLSSSYGDCLEDAAYLWSDEDSE